ncbi:DMT family transporter [Nevskia sp.]|uniref:DMT family transporter n=1 Tax=Nevskia sp. TaxID=1929292 RepID=UPI0025DD0383|nr:DMT family transporter [Nevskia sp.]
MKSPVLVLIPMLLALAAGAVLPFQAVLNGQLRGLLGSPFAAGLVSFSAGTLLLLAIVLLLRTPWPANVAAVPWYLWVAGGTLGVGYLIMSIWLPPMLGVALTFGLIVAGQLAMSLALDHFGWLGVAQHAINPWRVLGAALIVAGVILIRKF